MKKSCLKSLKNSILKRFILFIIPSRSPEYVSDGRWKFPIEDKMFSQYASLLAEHIPKIEVSTPYILTL